jgi:lipid-binding SYLF domain-containing protein
VLREMAQTSPIPQAQRDRTRCVVVIPSMVRVGLVLGGTFGRGVVTCRTTPGWSLPAFVKLGGGSAGLQAGVQSADLVMLITSERAVARLFEESFQLGVDASAAAGPVGQATQASTDTTMTAEILSYARSRGLFAGVEINGAVMRQDRAATMAFYGRTTEVHDVLTSTSPAPAEASAFFEQVRISFPPVPIASLDRGHAIAGR